MSDIDSKDFFRDGELVDDPYPYLAELRSKWPVGREPRHDVVLVTGYHEALTVLGDWATFSYCTPHPHRPPRTIDGTDHAEAPQGERGVHVGAGRRVLDSFLTGGRGEFIGGFAAPFSLLVTADLLGAPEEDRGEFAAVLGRRSEAGVGSTGDDTLRHGPLEYLYERFSRYIDDRRREPREDVLTGVAAAIFPDGSTPEVIDVVRVATNVFSAGQETTLRLLSSALKILAERPTSSSCCVASVTGYQTSSRRPCGSKVRSRVISGVAGTEHRWRR